MGLILGIDDTGIGSIAGPIVLAGAIINEDSEDEILLSGSGDSKKLSERKRNSVIDRMNWRPDVLLEVFYAETSAEDIDLYGLNKCVESCVSAILSASLSNFQISKIQLDSGLNGEWYRYVPDDIEVSIAPKDGEKLYPSVGLASVYGKTYRDKLMHKIGESHRPYGFGDNKGYGTNSHREAIEKFGPVVGIHRKNYLKTMFGEEILKYWD